MGLLNDTSGSLYPGYLFFQLPSMYILYQQTCLLPHSILFKSSPNRPSCQAKALDFVALYPAIFTLSTEISTHLNGQVTV